MESKVPGSINGVKLIRDYIVKAIVMEFELTLRAKLQDLQMKLRSVNVSQPTIVGEANNRLTKTIQLEIGALNNLLKDDGEYEDMNIHPK
jgi:hypothetical protein